MRKRAALSFDGSAWRVELPSCRVVDGSYAPVTAGLISRNGPLPGVKPIDVLALSPTVEVELDDALFDERGGLKLAELRDMYPERCVDKWAPPALTKP